jgi:hypothetical protein
MAERKSSEIESALLKKGFDRRDGSKHTIFTYSHQNLTTPIYTKLSRGSGYKSIGDSLLGQMSKQVRLTNQNFLRFIDCPMSAEEYKNALRSSGFLK